LRDSYKCANNQKQKKPLTLRAAFKAIRIPTVRETRDLLHEEELISLRSPNKVINKPLIAYCDITFKVSNAVDNDYFYSYPFPAF